MAKGSRGRDRMVVGFTTTCAYHLNSWEFKSRPWQDVFDATFCETDGFLRHTPVSSTNKTDCQTIIMVIAVHMTFNNNQSINQSIN